MSDTGESDDAYQNLNSRRGRKRKIIMRIEFNEADEASTDSDVSETNLIRPSSLFQKRSPLKRAIISSDDSSSSEAEVCAEKNGAKENSDVKNGEGANQAIKSEEGFASDSSSDETLEKCPICLLTFRNQEIASPSTCDHTFCFICLEEWAKNVTTCPIDRLEFKTIIVRESFLTKKVLREVKIKIETADVEAVNEDVTYCEVCHRPDREEVMLLCDGCNQGYHMDCLTPPLSEIPDGSWYCDHCFESEGDDIVDDLNLVYEDLREMGIPETRLRITEVRQPRVPRTRQIERVRARVFARNSGRHRELGNSRAQPEASTSTRSRSRKKSKKRKAARRRRTYVVEYDVNNYDEKFSIKTTKRYIKKRKTKRSRRRARNASCEVGAQNIPRAERPLLPAASFSVFGNPNELEYFSDSNDGFERGSGPGSTSVQMPVRFRNPTIRARKEILTRTEPSTPVDILSNILELQDRWHNITRRNQLSSVRIEADGRLNFQGNCEEQGKRANEKSAQPITEAPLYPRGNNPNFSGGERYEGHSNNYRNNSGFRNSGQYRYSTGSTGLNLNPFRRDDNSAQYNRPMHHFFSNNIQISPSFTERIRNQQNQRQDRRNDNRFSNNENSVTDQNVEQQRGEMNETPRMPESNTSNNSIVAPNIPDIGNYNNANNTTAAENIVTNYGSPELPSTAPTVIPPLAPPPWNKNLFRLAGDYDDDDDDDDADCPNFSIYSAESLQVARSSEPEESNLRNPEQGQEDDFEEKEEDLVQLGDDDEIPDAIESGKRDTNDSSDIYEPENPTDEMENEDEQKDECEGRTPEIITKQSEEEEIESNVETHIENENKNNANKQGDQCVSNKKGVLELYDETDWDEWNIDKNKLMDQTSDIIPSSEVVEDKEASEKDESVQENIQTESISEEEDRSYTPCLDEKMEHDDSTQNKDESHTPPKPVEEEKADSDRGDNRSTTVIDGMETELISDEDEILNQEQAGGAGKRRDRDKEENVTKKPRKETFKKISKSTKGRNYRGDKERVKGKDGRSRSRSNDKENRNSSRKNARRRVKRKEIERYDVRNVIGQPRTYKDRYGRDTSRPPRSRSRTRSRSRRRRSRSRSKFRSRSASSRRNRHSFSISPSPVSYPKSLSCRRSLSSRRSRSRRSRSRRRSPVRRRSRTPLRMRSPSPRVNGRRKRKFRRRSYSASSRSDYRSRSRGASLRRQRSKSLSRSKGKRKKSKDRKKKKIRKRSPSLSLSPAKHFARETDRRENRKKKRLSMTKSPLPQTWSPNSPHPNVPENNDSSWTPPLASSNAGNLTVILKNKENNTEAKKKAEKKKKKEKRRDPNKKERRKQRSEIRESPVAPSKEVFASGDNILVSVSFNKEGNQSLAPTQQTTVVTLPPTREEIVSKRRSPERGSKRQKKSREKGQRRHKKVDAKPVAIIDLDRSPFQEIVQSPKDVIILTDSDQEADEHGDFNSQDINMEIESLEQPNVNLQHDNIENCESVEHTETNEESFESSLQQMGPKTPPEPPVVKFSLATKSKQIKARNPLHEEQDEDNNEPAEEVVEELDKSNGNKIGPNTPPESGPCSPDAYDPFDPTKSPSISPSPAPVAEISTPVQNESSPAEDGRETRPPLTTAQEKNMNPVDLVMVALMNSKSSKSHEICSMNTDQQYTIPTNVEVNEMHDKSEEVIKSVTVLSNVLITPGKGQHRSSNIPTIASPVSKNSQSMGLASQSIVSKLPLPRTSSNNRQGSANDESINEIESPYSPGSDDYDDLFEPPAENFTSLQQLSQRTRMHGKSNKGNKTELFDNLFGNTSPLKIPSYTPTAVRKRGTKHKKTSVKVAKLPGSGKIDEDQIKIFDDLPSSAVELQVKDKFLRKLNRQERVVEEVKHVLKPHYNKKHITKEDYKEILRRAVPKICHSRSQEINPKKIQNLIEAYVKKFRQRNKLNILNTGQVSSAVKCAAYLKKL